MQERVDAVGFTVRESGTAGWFDLSCWVRKGERPGAAVETYGNLSLAEALDVIAAVLDSNQPGDEVGEGWIQSQFWKG